MAEDTPSTAQSTGFILERAVLRALLAGLVAWTWNIRQELTTLQQVVDRRTGAVERIAQLDLDVHRMDQELANRRQIIEHIPALQQVLHTLTVDNAVQCRDIVQLRSMVLGRMDDLHKRSLTLEHALQWSRPQTVPADEEGR